MNHKAIQKYMSYVAYVLTGLLVLVIALALIDVESNKKSPEEIERILNEQKAMMKAMAEGKPIKDHLPDPWPPEMNEQYPDYALIDQEGTAFNLKELEGFVLLVDYVDMGSDVSQAQSGAAEAGVYANMEYDRFTQPIKALLRKNTDGEFLLPHENIMQVKVLVYDEAGDQAGVNDAEKWARHFNLNKDDNVIVAVPEKDLRDELTKNMIGGYQLVDSNYFLRVDSAGPDPKHNLRMTLIPMVPKLVQ